MPELAEIKLTADYVNKSANGLKFTNVVKNPIHKGKELDIPFNKFQITAESRGKELVLYLKDLSSKETQKLFMTMGMTGYFNQTNTNQEKKHAHLKFHSTDGTTLSFVDVRRFGKWMLKEEWAENRGPDPTKEFEAFKENIVKNLDKAAFKHPIYFVLMNQKYFNGIGNYLRAEILYRLPYLNPFISAKEAILEEPKILELCRDIPNLAYVRGGGEIKDWDNPFGQTSGKFMKCYGNPNMLRIKDKNARMFWYDPKWEGYEK